MRIFNKKVSAIRFRCSDASEKQGEYTFEESSLDILKSKKVIDLGKKGLIKFNSVNDCFGVKDIIYSDVDFMSGEYMMFVFYKEKQTIDKSLMDRTIEHIRDKNPDMSKKSIKSKAKELLEENSSTKSSYTPVVIHVPTGQGMFFSSSLAEFALFSEVFFSPVEKIELCEDDYFLNWLWRRIERNPNKEVIDKTLEVGEEIVVVTPLGSVKAKMSDLVCCKAAIAQAGVISKMDLVLVHGGGDKSNIKINAEGVLTAKFVFDNTEEDNVADALIVADVFEDIFTIIEELFTEFNSVPEESLKSINKWAMGTFCSRMADDF